MSNYTVTVHMSPLMFNALALIAKNEKRDLDAQALYFLDKSVERYFITAGIFADSLAKVPPPVKEVANDKQRYVRIKINKKRARGWKWSDEARKAFSERQKLSWAKRKMTV